MAKTWEYIQPSGDSGGYWSNGDEVNFDPNFRPEGKQALTWTRSPNPDGNGEGYWQSSGGHVLADSIWSQIPANIREQAGNDPNKLLKNFDQDLAGSEQAWQPGVKIRDWSQATVDPEKGLVVKNEGFEPAEMDWMDRIPQIGLTALGSAFGMPWLGTAAAAGFDPNSQGVPGLGDIAKGGVKGYIGGEIASGLGGTEFGQSIKGGIDSATTGVGDFFNNLLPAVDPGTVADAGFQGVPGGIGNVYGVDTGGVGGFEGNSFDPGSPGGSLQDILNAPGAFQNAYVPGGGDSVGDPFIDAYTPTGTGGGPTGLPLPAAAGAGAASALSRILKGEGTAEDYLSLLGKAGAAGLGIAGSNAKNDAFTDLADKYLALGAPARARLEASYADPNSFLNGPDVQSITQQGSDAAARSLSTKYGNPALAPNAWAEINKINTGNQWNQLSNYRNQQAAQGQLGVAPGASFDNSAAGTSGDIYNIGGALLGDVTNPQKSVLEQMKQLAALGQGSGIFGTKFLGL